MFSMLRLSCLLLVLALPATAEAQQVLGSPLAAPPNWGAGCEVELGFFDPGPTVQGVYSTRVTNQDCTWFDAFAGVPGNGRIRSVSVRAGAGATAIRFVVARTLQGQGGPAGGGCCFFVAEFPPNPQPPLVLTPNQVNTFPVDIPVERNGSIQTGIVTGDVLGISAVPNTGELPLRDVDPGPNSTLTGQTTASFFYPRLGARPSDGLSSRNPQGIPGVEVLMNMTFVPPGPNEGGVQPPPPNTGGGPQLQPPPPPRPPAARAPSLAARAIEVARSQAFARLVCNGDAACTGRLTLAGLSTSARAAATKRPTYGTARYRLAPGQRKRLAVKLNARGRKLLRRKKRVTVELRLAPDGGTAVTTRVTLRRR